MMNNKIAYAVSLFCLTSQLCFASPIDNDNLLRNGDFNIPSRQVGSSSRYFGPPHHVMNNHQHPNHPTGRVIPYHGQTGAQDWVYHLSSKGYLNTQLLPSTRVEGGTMMAVDTNGTGNGIAQVYPSTEIDDKPVTACIWVYVERGRISIGLGSKDKLKIGKKRSISKEWKQIRFENMISPSEKITIYSAAPEGTRFYIESAYLTTAFPSFKNNNCKPK